jgi:general secretion pathway protein L
MPMIKNVVGLDLGSHTVKAVELRQTLRGLEPVQLRVHPRADPEAPVAELMRRFVKMHRIPLDHVTCAIPGDRVSSRHLDFPFRDRKKLSAAVPFEVEGEIPFALEDVTIDWEIVGGERNHAVVVAHITPKREVAKLLEGLSEWGCDPRIVEAEGLVLGNLASLFQLPGTRLLVDLGHRKTTFCLLVNERPVAARTIPVGGLALTEAIAEDRGWNLADAEHAKCEDGVFQLGFNSGSPGAVAILDRIAREIVRTLEAQERFLGGSPETQVAALTLCGGSARLQRIDEFLAERTGIAAARLSAAPESAAGMVVAGGDPVLFASALALALRGTAQARTRTDFRQGEFTYRTDFRQLFGQDLRSTAALGGAVLVLLAVSVGTDIALESRRASRLEAEIQSIFTEAFPDQAAPERPLAAMRNAVASARDRADFLGVYGGNRSALDLLAELSRRVPKDLKVKFEEVNIDRQGVRIKVFAEGFEAADRLESELAREAPFRSAKAGEISTDRKRGGQTFSLSISLEQVGDDA